MKKEFYFTLAYRLSIVLFLTLACLLIAEARPIGFFKYVRLFGLLLIGVELVRIYITVIKTSTVKKKVNMGLGLVSVLITVVTLEAVFMFVPKSHFVGYTLSSKLWFDKYWGAANSLGYRDKEPDFSKPFYLFVGDSFTAGHGIKRTEQRFSNQVGVELQKKNITAINIGMNGSDTRQQFLNVLELIAQSGKKPEKIILQYFGNDIEAAAKEQGLCFTGFKPHNHLPRLVKPLIKGSYLINFIYWSLPKEEMKGYIDYLTLAYHDADIMNSHLQDLAKFVEFSQTNEIELIVVLFPFLQDTELSYDLFMQPLTHFFNLQGIKTINVTDLIQEIPLNDRVVHANDGHASVKVHGIVAKDLVKVLD